MGKLIIIALFITQISASDIYQKNCVSCHANYPVKLDKLFMRYLLKYSSERSMKQALYAYMKKPDYYTSVMYEGFINRFGIKVKSTLNESELKEAIDIYWNLYRVKKMLK